MNIETRRIEADTASSVTTRRQLARRMHHLVELDLFCRGGSPSPP